MAVSFALPNENTKSFSSVFARLTMYEIALSTVLLIALLLVTAVSIHARFQLRNIFCKRPSCFIDSLADLVYIDANLVDLSGKFSLRRVIDFDDITVD